VTGEGSERGTTAPPTRQLHPVFRWSGQYWGFVEDDRLFDRYGREAGWLACAPERPADVFDLAGHFLGELVDGRHVLRYTLRPAPIQRGPRPGGVHPAPPDPWPDLDPRDPCENWSDALPWPLPPPDPPRR
jgi:hypothetical protein